MGAARAWRWAGRLAAGGAAIGGLGLLVLVVFVLPAIGLPGVTGADSSFEFLQSCGLRRATSDGVRYTVNNSVATFALDVERPDAHCRRLFADYAAALAYCREHGLPVIPSVQLVQGKCKQFDDGLCATLEAAVQHGLPGDPRLGKHAALARLLDRLLRFLDQTPGDGKAAVEAAVVHVATALKLGGGEQRLGPGLAAKVRTAEQAFLAVPRTSKPIGFWTWTDELRRLFRQDRYLARGLRLDRRTGACIVLARAIAGDAEVAETFTRLRDLDARLTNAPVYIDPAMLPAPPARCASFRDVMRVVPAGVPLSELLALSRRDGLRAALTKELGDGAGFALVSYAESKEYTLLYKLWTEGRFSGREHTMRLIIDAVRSGRLSLAPRPDSGWYDYQWHALETLLRPDRARESAKLELSNAYKRRLADAFRTSLTKHRETHIKHLPGLCQGVGPEPEERPQVDIGPEFSVEPTATVFLRYGRAYRFLRDALHATCGRGFLAKLHRSNEGGPPEQADLDTELRRMALLCYGLYDRLCLEIGQLPGELPDDMPPEDLEAARQEATQWLASLAHDPDLARDTRVAVPIVTWPGGPTCYWATGGIRLQRVVYKYRLPPKVAGPIEARFVPTRCYLPTDVFLEFERPSETPLTRAEFRALCDRHGSEDALRAALGAPATRGSGGEFPFVAIGLSAAGAAALAMVWRFRQAVLTRRVRRVALCGGLAVLVLWLVALVLLPGYRTRFLVKYVARLSPPLGMVVEARLFGPQSCEVIDALSRLLSDPDPQVRYLAARLLNAAWPCDDKALEMASRIPGLEQRLRAAAADEVAEVADYTVGLLALFPSESTVDCLLARLKARSHVDRSCWSTLHTLGRIGNPRALDAVLPFTDDPRPIVRAKATISLGNYDDERAVRRLMLLARSNDAKVSQAACTGIGWLVERSPHSLWRDELDKALLVPARRQGFTPDLRFTAASHIASPAIRATAYTLILKAPSADGFASVAKCRVRAIEHLGELGAAAAPSIRALEAARDDPRRSIRAAATEALQSIQAAVAACEASP